MGNPDRVDSWSTQRAGGGAGRGGGWAVGGAKAIFPAARWGLVQQATRKKKEEANGEEGEMQAGS